MIYVVQKHEHKNVVIQSEQDNVHGDRHYCTDGQKDCYFNTDFFNDTYFNDDIDQDSTTHYDVDANSSTLLQD